ncbi:hypothetical protein WOLCODRAFT_163525 [Wolfiporia cocos MD-104 SS10]|uniref:MYND-type domain-containing protein n=1 Tax=Wolfiporia cocos (strain MD-104) TaxID=742152 RepID=A0A2H3K114_WOLCO|nr:hypothetical protein WOLCODRAFT_163525 [Wolfiporia cocos MD-104 SS10]
MSNTTRHSPSTFSAAATEGPSTSRDMPSFCTGAPRPSLPKKLLDKLLSDPTIRAGNTMIYDVNFDRFRALRIHGQVEPTAKITLNFDTEDRRQLGLGDFHGGTFLHFAALIGDLPLAYECVRLNGNIDQRDNTGATALYTAVRYLASLGPIRAVHEWLGIPWPSFRAEACERIAAMLIQQHADVNVCVDDWSVMEHACRTLRWSLIRLMLCHGAEPPSESSLEKISRGLSPNEVHRLRETLYEARAEQVSETRPPRPCPCFSGKLLVHCHAAEKVPYPPEFICPCGADKTYRRCCQRRDFGLFEIWNEERQRIVRISCHADYRRTSWRMEDEMQNDGSVALNNDEQESKIAHIADFLLGVGAADPAYIYAVKQQLCFPKPWERRYSKAVCRNSAEHWNNSVDEYIDNGSDPRPRYEIEVASKLATDGGPLYKRCEAAGCSHIQGPDLQMKCCSGCKRIWYCSRTCQEADWPAHKRRCKNRTHPLQMLPSQSKTNEMFQWAWKVGAQLFGDSKPGEDGADNGENKTSTANSSSSTGDNV